MQKTSTDLDAFVVQFQTVAYSPGKDLANFNTVSSLLTAAFHPSILVNYATLDDAVTNGFADNVLCVFLGIEMEFDTNVPEGNA